MLHVFCTNGIKLTARKPKPTEGITYIFITMHIYTNLSEMLIEIEFMYVCSEGRVCISVSVCVAKKKKNPCVSLEKEPKVRK